MTAFGVLLAIGILFSLFSVAISFSEAAIDAVICDKATNPFIQLACLFPDAVDYALGFAEYLISIMIVLAVMKPLHEISKGEKVSNWTSHVQLQLPNSIKIMIFRTLLDIAVLAPLLIFIALNITFFLTFAKQVSTNGITAIVIADIIAFAAIIIATIIVAIITTFMLVFLEVEIALTGKGLQNAAKNSFNLVKNNFVAVLAFLLLWFAVSIVVAVVTLIMACTCCLLPAAIALEALIVQPVYLLSTIMLWNELKARQAPQTIAFKKMK